MRLLKLHVENFGALQGFDYEFEDGLNVLYRPNGWGKSTLAVFIKAMLYGLPASTKQSLDKNERKKYAPWQGGAWGGSLEIETAAGRFRIERFFGAKEANDTFALYDLDTHLPSNAYSERLGEELFGLDADGFERSSYLSQRELDDKPSGSIPAKLGGVLDNADDLSSYEDAMAALDKRRKFYVMTGGRGAIAELEQEILEKTAELERCRRIEDAMHAQEDELTRLLAELDEAGRREAQTRLALERAALARERAAHTEQKQRMLTSLSELAAEDRLIHEFFGGNPPDEEELDGARRLYDEIRAQRARLDAIPTVSADRAEYDRLYAVFGNDVPDDTALDRLVAKNDALGRIDAELSRLSHTDELSPALDRFREGVPSKTQIDRAFSALREADELSKTAANHVPVRETSRTRTRKTVALLTLLLGIVAASLSFLPMLSALSLPLLIVGGAVGAVGLILLMLPSNGKASDETAAAEHQARRDALLETVRALLKTYSMPTDDLTRSLTELSLFAEQYTASSARREAATEEQKRLTEKRGAIADSLSEALSRYALRVSDSGDFTNALHALRRAVERYRQLRASEERLATDRKNAEQALDTLKRRLLPFLRRYDPEGSMRAGQCLDRVAEQLSEHRRLSREIARRENELRAFIAEKKLDGEAIEVSATEFDRLSREAETLGAETAELHRRHATLKSSIDRLALDADRIPDLEEQLARLGETLAEAKANAKTVKSTAAFLEEAKLALTTRYLGGMQESFNRNLGALSEITPEILLDASLDAHLREGGKTHPVESFSRGWRDLIEFCTRLALTEALYKDGEAPFLLLDDPFVNLDDDRLAAARALLTHLSKSYQILYLVCHTDRT